MKTTISRGNTKLGSIPNFSLTPIVTCSPDACQHCGRDCYAMKAYRMYSTTRAAWDRNTELARNDLATMEQDLSRYFAGAHAPRFFRIHVAGDFVTREYAEMWARVAAAAPHTNFLAFTKCFDIIRGVAFPANFTLMLSAWPGMDVPADLRTLYHVAWLQDGTENRVPCNALECPGHCDGCGACWNMNSDVVFHKH